MTIARVEIYRRADPTAAPQVLAGATLEATSLPTLAALQPVAPCGPLEGRAAMLARVEAFGGPVYAAAGPMPDPTREPRTLVIPYPGRAAGTLLPIGPGERVAVLRADDVALSLTDERKPPA